MAQRDFRHVNGVNKAVRMSWLIINRDVSLEAFFHLRGDFADIAVKSQPEFVRLAASPAIDPGSPSANLCDQVRSAVIIEDSSDPTEFFDVQSFP
ncbi:hypothetical protein [Paenibacillus sp. AR247]|uniref:hypothetical protein n=1 Tax=Paenibacillus sp. AR247 TaxID=1631599 RepID=UPI00215797CA|nr:hypothetical protein [Paenibacillus sp. AR247]